MTRYPDGIDGKSFFQKDAPNFAPDWIRLERIWSEHAEREIDYFVCDDLETLLYVANLGSIPLHVWASRVAAPERPDWCILDLDPKGAPFSHVVTIARAIRELCEEIELPSFIKTSGATGLHVLSRSAASARTRSRGSSARSSPASIEQQHGKIATTARALGARGGKVYVDYLQNGHGKTIAGPVLGAARPRRDLLGAPEVERGGREARPEEVHAQDASGADEEAEGRSAGARPDAQAGSAVRADEADRPAQAVTRRRATPITSPTR